MLLVLQLGKDGHDNLAKVDPGHCALGLSKGTQHICLEPLSPSTGQHLVDTEDMEGLEMHSDVKPFLPQLFSMYLLAQIHVGK